jgi:hypothetical protein
MLERATFAFQHARRTRAKEQKTKEIYEKYKSLQLIAYFICTTMLIEEMSSALCIRLNTLYRAKARAPAKTPAMAMG